MARLFRHTAVGALLLLSLCPAFAIDTPIKLRMRDAYWANLLAATPSTTTTTLNATYELAYQQPLDHFNVLTGGPTWAQRVWVNEAYFNNATGGPLFLYLEGEAAGGPGSVTGGQHVELAANHSALLISIEHRYYGASLPTTNQSTDNLAFLSHEQALADVAHFLASYVPTHWNLSRTVTFGGSYSGALSAWARVRLPHLVHAGFSTSGPVEPVINFTGYGLVTGNAMANPAVGGSPACLTALQAAYTAIDAAFHGSAQQQAAMSSKMHACAAPTSAADLMWAESNLGSVVMGIVQYNNPSGGLNVASVCATMTQAGVAPEDAYASVVREQIGAGEATSFCFRFMFNGGTNFCYSLLTCCIISLLSRLHGQQLRQLYHGDAGHGFSPHSRGSPAAHVEVGGHTARGKGVRVHSHVF